LGNVTAVDAALLIPPEVSTLHAVFTPLEAANSSLANPVYVEVTLVENFTVTVVAPAVLTTPVHNSRS
jgi:hypothetical protein